jgi:DNA-binding CsgD family transcriptional regulator
VSRESLGPSEAKAKLDRLTPKQLEVLELVVQRKTSKQIARILGISKPAVDQRIASARDSLGVETRDEAALIYMQANPAYDRITYDPAQLPESTATEAEASGDLLLQTPGSAVGSHPPGTSDTLGGGRAVFLDMRQHLLEKLNGRFRVGLRTGVILGLALGIMMLILITLSVSEALTRLFASS